MYKKRNHDLRRLANMRKRKEQIRLGRDAPDYPASLPDKRITITITRHDCGEETHTFELMRGPRVDMYNVNVDGRPWKTCGLSRVLEGIRKSMPRFMST